MSSGVVFGCNNNKPFSVKAWNEKEDILYTQRKYLVQDLIRNHLKQEMCYEDLVKLLGSPVDVSRKESKSTIYFEVETKYGSDIDPDWVKYLEVALTSDSCYENAQVIKLKWLKFQNTCFPKWELPAATA